MFELMHDPTKSKQQNFSTSPRFFGPKLAFFDSPLFTIITGLFTIITMRFLTLLATAAATAAVGHAYDAFPNITGIYRQTHSNMYVQYTTEIDWKCVQVHVKVDDNATDLEIYKQARLHGGPVTVTTPVQKALLGSNKFTVVVEHNSVPPVNVRSYDIHPYSNDTYVITGEDTPSLYVWQLADSTEEPVDIARLQTFLKKIGFDIPDPHYRNITATYDPSTC